MNRFKFPFLAILSLFYFAQNGFSQTSGDFISREIDALLGTYYKTIFTDSSKDCKSFYRLFPKYVQVELWKFEDSNQTITRKKIPYNPEYVYSTLPYRKIVLDSIDILNYKAYLGNAFETSAGHYFKDYKFTPIDSSASRLIELKKFMDVNFTATYSYEHSFIHNVETHWVFESDFTTSYITFENDFTQATIKINFSSWLHSGWTYFEKRNGKWEIKKVDVFKISSW